MLIRSQNSFNKQLLQKADDVRRHIENPVFKSKSKIDRLNWAVKQLLEIDKYIGPNHSDLAQGLMNHDEELVVLRRFNQSPLIDRPAKEAILREILSSVDKQPFRLCLSKVKRTIDHLFSDNESKTSLRDQAQVETITEDLLRQLYRLRGRNLATVSRAIDRQNTETYIKIALEAAAQHEAKDNGLAANASKIHKDLEKQLDEDLETLMLKVTSNSEIPKLERTNLKTVLGLLVYKHLKEKSFKHHFNGEEMLKELKGLAHIQDAYLARIKEIGTDKKGKKLLKTIVKNMWVILKRKEAKLPGKKIQIPSSVRFVKGAWREMAHFGHERSQKEAVKKGFQQTLSNTGVIVEPNSDKLIVRTDNLQGEKFRELIALYAKNKLARYSKEIRKKKANDSLFEPFKLFNMQVLDDTHLKGKGSADEGRMIQEARDYLATLENGREKVRVEVDGDIYTVNVQPCMINLGVSHFRNTPFGATYKSAIAANKPTVDALATDFVQTHSGGPNCPNRIEVAQSKMREFTNWQLPRRYPKLHAYNKAKKNLHAAKNLSTYLTALREFQAAKTKLKYSSKLKLNLPLRHDLERDFKDALGQTAKKFFDAFGDDSRKKYAINAIIHSETNSYSVSLDGLHVEKLTHKHNRKNKAALGALSLWSYSSLAAECGYDKHYNCKSGQDRTTEAIALELTQQQFEQQVQEIDLVRLFGVGYNDTKALVRTVRAKLNVGEGELTAVDQTDLSEDDQLRFKFAKAFTENLDAIAASYHGISRDAGTSLKTKDHPIMKFSYLHHKESPIGHAAKNKEAAITLDEVSAVYSSSMSSSKRRGRFAGASLPWHVHASQHRPSGSLSGGLCACSEVRAR